MTQMETTSLTQLAALIQREATGQEQSTLGLLTVSKAGVDSSEHYMQQVGSASKSLKDISIAAVTLNSAFLLLGALGLCLPVIKSVSFSVAKGLTTLAMAGVDTAQSVYKGKVSIGKADANTITQASNEAAGTAGKLDGQDQMKTVADLYSANNIVGQQPV